MPPKSEVIVKAKKFDGSVIAFKAVVQLNTPVEVNYYRNRGILQTVLRNLVK
jgi:aconitate hydratase